MSSTKLRDSHSPCVRPRRLWVAVSHHMHALLFNLALPNGTVYPVVDHHEFTEKMLPVKADLAICSPVTGVSG